jgi:hypothetical protein
MAEGEAMSSVRQAMLRIYAHLDASSIEAARNIARWARETGKPVAPYEAEVAAAIARAEREADAQAEALALMDTVKL